MLFYRARLQACEAERDALISENERLMKLVSSQRTELSRLRLTVDANQHNTTQQQENGHNTLPTPPEPLPTPPLPKDNNSYTDTAQHNTTQHNTTLLMLKEAHDCLVNSNKSLLNELNELKINHQNELKQWSCNFDLLKQHYQNLNN